MQDPRDVAARKWATEVMAQENEEMVARSDWALCAMALLAIGTTLVVAMVIAICV